MSAKIARSASPLPANPENSACPTGHRRARVWLIGAAALLLVAPTACNNDPAEPEAVLTEAEAEALFRGISAIYQDTTLAATEVSENEIVVACPLGGEARGVLGGSDGQRGDTLWIIVDVEVVPSDCRLAYDGIEITAAGGNLRSRTEAAIAGFFEDVNIEGTVMGAIEWEVDDGSGECAIDLVLEVELDLTALEPQGVYRGTMCGEEVEYDGVVVPIPQEALAPGS